jgi:hypothetical protein
VLPKSLLSVGGLFRWLLQATGFWKRIQAIDSGHGRYDRLGFRVPAVVVSPYAKQDYVSPQDRAYDHTSVLKLIERKWNLPPLTRRDAAAEDPLDMVDFDGPPRFLDPPDLAPPAVAWPPEAVPSGFRRLRPWSSAGWSQQDRERHDAGRHT